MIMELKSNKCALAALAAIVVCSGAAVAVHAQQPGSTKEPPKATQTAPADAGKVPRLEELLSRALKENPDIRVAETKLREAEAELNRTRLQVTQKVVAVH